MHYFSLLVSESFIDPAELENLITKLKLGHYSFTLDPEHQSPSSADSDSRI